MTSNLIRNTKAGRISGIILNNDKILAWLGVPYAEPPVGELRWRAPQTLKPWGDVRETKSYANVSVQKDMDKTIGDEDCLALNVFRPNSDKIKLPVLFFIHGGNNQTDSGELLDGAYMAENLEAVIVTINLRLNALGWLNIEAIKTGDPLENSGNFGFLDIHKALTWVHENISEFGGDAGNITACGYSSGARDLLCMLISPLFRGMFARSITFSGGFTVTDPEIGARTSTKALAQLVLEDEIAGDLDSAINWLNSATAEVKNWLMALSSDRMATLMAGAAIRMKVFPHLFADGVTIPSDGFASIARGEHYAVPMMLLSGSNEFSFQANNDPMFKGKDLCDADVMNDYKFACKYGSALFGYANAEHSAKAFSTYENQPPIFAARFAWGTNPEITDEIGAMCAGGTHGLDLFTMMGIERDSYNLSPNFYTAKNRKGRVELGELYLAYVNNFIRTGDPNAENLPQWESWNSENPKLLRTDADNEKAVVYMDSGCVVDEEKLFEDLLEDTAVSAEIKAKIIEEVLNERFFSDRLDPFWQANK